MSNRISQAFARAKQEGRGAFVAYLTMGYPTLAASEAAADALIAGGADIIELDVSRSLDGTLYCFHPCMEPRFTASEKYISQMRDEEVKKLRLVNLDGAATEEPVPLLEEGPRLLRGKCQRSRR